MDGLQDPLEGIIPLLSAQGEAGMAGEGTTSTPVEDVAAARCASIDEAETLWVRVVSG